MILTLTEKENARIQEIQEEFKPKMHALTAQLKATTDAEERRRLIIERQAVYDSMLETLEAYFNICQREHFQPIKDAGTDAVIKHALGQIPDILEQNYNIANADYKALTAAEVKKLNVGTKKGNKLYINANYAAQLLRDELKLHIEALQDNKTALQQLLEKIIEAVETSDYTDNTEITITDTKQKPLEVMRFRRNPLAEINLFGIMNDKATAQLIQDTGIFKQKADGQLTLQWAVNQAPQKKEAVPVYMSLTYEGTDYKVTKKLTAFDKQVYEAVSTRFYYWQQDNPQSPLYITPQEIWRTMNGKKSGGSKLNNPSKAQVQRICDSLDKMRFTRFFMDISKEIKAFNLSIDDERLTGGHIETYVLNSSKVEFVTDKGNTVQGYRIGEEPILYTYNKAKNHILYVPYEMLDTSQYTSDSENVAEFKGYLLQQIQHMKNAKEGGKGFKRSNTILLDTIYSSTGILPPEERTAGKDYKNDTIKQREVRRFRQADREKIEGILEAWKAKSWINGYAAINKDGEPVKERQAVKGYRISI